MTISSACYPTCPPAPPHSFYLAYHSTGHPYMAALPDTRQSVSGAHASCAATRLHLCACAAMLPTSRNTSTHARKPGTHRLPFPGRAMGLGFTQNPNTPVGWATYQPHGAPAPAHAPPRQQQALCCRSQVIALPVTGGAARLWMHASGAVRIRPLCRGRRPSPWPPDAPLFPQHSYGLHESRAHRLFPLPTPTVSVQSAASDQPLLSPVAVDDDDAGCNHPGGDPPALRCNR